MDKVKVGEKYTLKIEGRPVCQREESAKTQQQLSILHHSVLGLTADLGQAGQILSGSHVQGSGNCSVCVPRFCNEQVPPTSPASFATP